MTDWLAICREARDEVERLLEELPPREREAVVGAGMGGDDTTAIDAAAEQAVLRRLDGFTVVSEEIGRRDGDGTYVVVDPIDGSINAKRGIPFFAVSIAVAEGPRMDDVFFGYVYDFGSREEWVARRGGGAFLDDVRLDPETPRERIELLAFEATTTDLVARHAGAFVGVAHRIRIMGSLALSLCHLAAGRVDAVCSLKAARSVDIAAAQLVVREVGLAIELPDAAPLAEAPLDLEGRSRVVAAGTAATCREIAQALH